MHSHTWIACCESCGQHEMRFGGQRPLHVTQRQLCSDCFRAEVLRQEATRSRMAENLRDRNRARHCA